ncbi:hypothetical protein [Fructobacillus evanidus]|uniref:Uncharacterized protein n=1 Tax=Fructobacillus evanidus TaxID=3064281 RepID=A0ABM9MX11_9LACO|nr:unnamed protein product [Fructobacillus sp. LMG 32999]CAK1229950.1 unnamed protein product [Fructobacillus sp. LMG 32999]CAK1230702.1 unnamed protein product [Fructobacillus sp. LMG 32999]CAK1230759.1 unnamed protein product [Fructobacillus sp. LMG 32999]CAK1231895.1 unnamed protein product [Fructobacillus sp. LMG 32999]
MKTIVRQRVLTNSKGQYLSKKILSNIRLSLDKDPEWTFNIKKALVLSNPLLPTESKIKTFLDQKQVFYTEKCFTWTIKKVSAPVEKISFNSECLLEFFPGLYLANNPLLEHTDNMRLELTDHINQAYLLSEDTQQFLYHNFNHLLSSNSFCYCRLQLDSSKEEPFNSTLYELMKEGKFSWN